MGKNTFLLKHPKKLFAAIIFFIAVTNMLMPVIRNRNRFLEKFNSELYEKKYNRSQYVIPRSKTPISDEELLSYAGYRYATGLNPILINSDHPPLGKYIIGSFTILSGNNRIVSLFFAAAAAVLLMSVVFKLTQSFLLASLALLFASVDTVFADQIIYSPVLDIIQLSFFLLFVYFFLAWMRTKKNMLMLLLGVSLGAMSATKIYFPALLLSLVVFLFFLLVTRNLKKTILSALVLHTIAFLVYAASYSRYFMLGNSFRAFFGVQKWIFLFWKNNSIQVAKYYGSVIPLILFNRWKVWWGTKQFINFEHWSIFWPIFFILGITSACYFLSKGLPKNFFQLSAAFLSGWVIAFTLYLCFVPISPRYLMMLYFPLYILICLFIKVKYKNYV